MENYLTIAQFARALGENRTNGYHLAQHVTTAVIGGVLAVPRHAAVAYCEARIWQHENSIRQLRSAIAEIMSTDIGDEDDSTKTDF
jgi:hypothetical protein